MRERSGVLCLSCLLILSLIKFSGTNLTEMENLEKNSLNSFFYYHLLPSRQVKYCSLIFLRSSSPAFSENVFDSDENLKLTIAESYKDSCNILLPSQADDGSVDEDVKVRGKVNSRLNPVTSTKRLSSNCFLSVIFIRDAQNQIEEDSNEKLSKELKEFFTVLTTPIKFSLTKVNEDFYVFVTSGEKVLEKTLLNANVAFKFRYKLGISTGIKNNLVVKAICLYCNNGEPKLVNLWKNNNNIAGNFRNVEFFENFLKNFNGKKMRASLVTFGDGNNVKFVNGVGTEIIKSGGGFIRSFISAAESLNFTYVLFNGRGTGLRYKNGTFDGVVGDLIRNPPKADIGACIGVTLDRFFLVDVCTSLLYFRLSFAYGPTQRIYDWKSIFWPFSLSMWICLGVFSLLAWSFFELLDRTENRLTPLVYDKNRNKTLVRNNFVLYITASMLLQNTENLHAKSTRIFSVWWLFFMLIISTVYLSKLYGFFASPLYENAPSNFEELADARDWKISFTFYKGAIYQFFQSAKKSSAYHRIFKRMKKADPYTCHKRTLEEKAVCIAFISVTEAEVMVSFGDRSGHSRITQARSVAFEIPISLAVKKNSILGPSLSRITSGQFESGIINLWAEWKNNDRRVDRIEEELKTSKNAAKNNGTQTIHSLETFTLVTNKPSRLDLLQLRGAIALYCTGLIVASVISATEIIVTNISWIHTCSFRNVK